MQKQAIEKFHRNLCTLFDGKKVNLYASSIDATLERICSALFKSIRGEAIWYDGTSDLTASILKDGELIFRGTMNVMEGQKKHWTEQLTVITKATAKASECEVSVNCGEYQASGNIYDLFDIERDSD